MMCKYCEREECDRDCMFLDTHGMKMYGREFERKTAEEFREEGRAQVRASFKAELPADIVAAIVKDLCGRRGLDYMWESIDDDIRESITDKWIKDVRNIFEKSS